jgi:2-haloacid dehalogenase
MSYWLNLRSSWSISLNLLRCLNCTFKKGKSHLTLIVARTFKHGKFKVYGLTNWSAETFPYAFNTYKFLQSFEGIVVSGEEKMIKPEKGIYLTLLERYNLKPEETFFMDDNIKNVEVAKSRGIHAIHFTGTDENLAEIGKILKIKI